VANNILPNGVPIGLTHKFLSQLNARKSMGFDNIPTCLYKHAADILAAPLTHIIAISFEQSSVPKNWKNADVIVLPKSKPASINNLRPISLLATPAKIMEKILLHYVKEFLISKYDKQHFGFQYR